MPSGNASVFDQDLNPVIKACSNEELQYLVDLLTGTFTNFLTLEEDFEKYYPDHQKYADLIASHIRMFGGNSLANAARGLWTSLRGKETVSSKGPQYRKIVSDVAKKLKVEFNKKNETKDLEFLILKKVFEKYLQNATEEQKKKLLEESMKDISKGTDNTIRHIISGGGLTTTAALMKLLSADGSLASLRLATTASHHLFRHMVGRTLPGAVTFSCSSMLGIYGGPLLWAPSAIWSLLDLSSPASRITVPAVIYVAILRRKQQVKQQGENV